MIVVCKMCKMSWLAQNDTNCLGLIERSLGPVGDKRHFVMTILRNGDMRSCMQLMHLKN